MKMRKVGIVGAGAVGASAAYALTLMGTCKEIVLFDVAPGVAQGKSIDIAQAGYYAPQDTIVTHADTPSDMKNCDIVVITAGVPRKPGMTRADLLMINAKITKEVIKGVAKYSPDAIIIMVSNPLDAMTYVALKESGFDRSRVIGMAGILDSSRMAAFIQEKLGYGGGQIRASVMGGHGDDMVPLPRYSTVAGVPLSDVLTDAEIEEIVERTRKGGAEIVGHLKTGSAYYAPAKSTAIMVNAILKDTKQIYPCAVLLEGEYGFNDVVSGVPVMIGANGAEKILEVTLNEQEKVMFENSCKSVQGLIDTLKENNFFDGE
jgi:malate dehydrogenase